MAAEHSSFLRHDGPRMNALGRRGRWAATVAQQLPLIGPLPESHSVLPPAL